MTELDNFLKLADEIDTFVKKLTDEPDQKQLTPSNDKYQGKVYQLPLRVGKKGLSIEHGEEEPWMISKFVSKEIYISERHKNGHPGWDQGGPKGAPVYAIAPGIVTKVSTGTPKGGNSIWIQHFPDEKLSSYYAHLDEILVSVGQKVNFDTIIGKNGNTGSAKGTAPHVHLQTRLNGVDIDPKNVIGKPIGSFK